MLFRSNDTATTEIYTLLYTLSLHDALPTSLRDAIARAGGMRLASEFISPLDLVAVGLAGAEEAAALAAAEGDAI